MCCTCHDASIICGAKVTLADCPVHGGEIEDIAALLTLAETALPRPGGDIETCICRVIDEPPGTAELAIHEDCPIHWREAPDD